MAGVGAPGTGNGGNGGGGKLRLVGGKSNGGKSNGGNGGNPNAGANSTGPVNILTQQQITNQATKLVSSAYKPAYNQLNNDAKTASGLADKRAADNKYYGTWLASQNQQLIASNTANNAHLQNLESGLINTQNSLYGTQAPSMVGAANARPGNVSDNSTSNDFGTAPSNGGQSQLQQNQAANEGQLTNTAAWSDGLQSSMNSALTAGAANNQSVVGVADISNQSDLQKTMTSIGTARETLSAKQANDLTKVESGLTLNNQKGQEYNATYGLTQAKVGSAIANTNSEINNRLATQQTNQQRLAQGQQRLNLDGQKFNFSQQVAAWHQQDSTRTYQLDTQKYDLSVQKEIYARQKSTMKKPLSVTSQNAIYNRIDGITAEINQAIQAGATPQRALQMVATGGRYPITQKVVNAKGKTVDRTVESTYKGYGADSTVQLAYALSTGGGGGLSSQQVRLMNAMGLTGVLNHYSELPTQPESKPHVGAR